ncbi:MCE family protein [Mycobacterium sp. CVI_P3]|uniref:MCE family protein n=1 Tax=Mycobacterium pinniadriaticum TaxID=2994102 RepID=A0ABT3SEJ3_9MYCO|nr:MCE family protein [Mycobacterium pinniadriaticum]MCX2931674.1 MCE family protein [Mycobacterium pinniadriaticum]MCX2937934.1 MCE family protein [Mycobacterium pinniadriaticum]
MKTFKERNLLVIGAVGIGATAAVVVGVLEYHNLPFLNPGATYSAYFAEAGGLSPGAAVQVSGYQVGSVESVGLDGTRVVVRFKIDNDVHLGDRTEAAIKTKSLLGAKILEVDPRGQGSLSGPIPLERTTSPYQLNDVLGDLAATVQHTDTGQLSESLATLAQTFADTPPDLQLAVQGLSRFSQTLNTRDQQLRDLLTSAKKATGVLANRSDQVVSLIANTNALLAQLRTESDALDDVMGDLSAMSKQLSGFVSDNRQQMRPALDKLNGALTIVANRKDRVQESLHRLNAFAMSLGESVSSGPFFNAYVANLLPGQFIQPFVDAAFSDLGLDPNVKLPSELVDPPTGQPATPALPIPFPRTGQGGTPNLTLPDAITGNPGDPRYPYREPLPAPPPGGAPPGPPAVTPPDPGAAVEPTPSPVYVPAPGEPNPAGGAR